MTPSITADAPENETTPWAWAGTLHEFLECSERAWLLSLLRHGQNRFLSQVAHQKQIVSWRKTFAFLKEAIAQCMEFHPEVRQAMLVFEYELLLENGNRPDVILVLSNGCVLVIECKEALRPSPEAFEQVRCYALRIQNFHSESHTLNIVPILLLLDSVPTKRKQFTHSSVRIMSSTDMSLPTLREIISNCLQVTGQPIGPKDWLGGWFMPKQELIKTFIEYCEGSSIGKGHLDEHCASLLASVSGIVEQTRAQKSYALILMADGPMKAAFALQAIIEQTKQGVDCLYLVRDTFRKTGLPDLLDHIGFISEQRPELSLVRGTEAFLRYATRDQCKSAASFYLFDDTKQSGVFSPVNANCGLKSPEAVTIHALTKREWGAAVVFLQPDTFGSGAVQRKTKTPHI